MLKIFVYESSVAKNHMYDLEKMSEVKDFNYFRGYMNKINQYL